jgi:hypothetical protein
MINKIKNFFFDIRDRQKIQISLSKGIAMRESRMIDPKNPHTWEFSGFSQNGEDGIIDYLRNKIKIKNNYFIEIGSANGFENNSAWLLFTQNYSGIMIDGNPNLIKRAKRLLASYSIGLQILNMFVTNNTISDIKKNTKFLNPDVFSLDIDGNDYFIAKEILKQGFRPKIFIVEYNSVFGPEKSLTIVPSDNFEYISAHPSGLYYGVSISGWVNFFTNNNYYFVSVDSKGVNAFFIDKNEFDANFISGIKQFCFIENELQHLKYKCNYDQQFKIIESMNFHTI